MASRIVGQEGVQKPLVYQMVVRRIRIHCDGIVEQHVG